MTKISFVVPAFNEEKNIPHLYNRIVKLMEKSDADWEIIFINDGSVDKTLTVLKAFAHSDKRVKYLNLSRNFGHQAALTGGLKYATGDAIVSMDCDLQDPPEVIEEMIGKWREGFHVVYARRKNFRKDNFLKRKASQVFYKLLDKFSDVRIPRNVGDFRLIDQKVLREINRMPEHSRYLRGMVAWTGFRFTFVDYFRPDREEGESGYTFAKLFGLAMSGMMNFSFLPLRFGLFMGVFSIIVGIILLAIQVFDSLFNHAYYHLYKWLVVVLVIFTGFIFMLLWILGEYIGKIYDEVRQRPVFIVEEKGNFDENSNL